MKRFAVTSLLVAASTLASRDAAANGRNPASSSIVFRANNPSDVAIGLTWGAVVSRDGGQTFQWYCEDAVGYSGNYDPDYEWLANGGLLATTFNGLLINKDACSFERTQLAHADGAPLSETFFITNVERTASNVLLATDSGVLSQGRIYKSTDEAATWSVASMIGANGDWFASIKAAPSDANRVYLTAYRQQDQQPRMFFIYRSNDGASTWVTIATTPFTTSSNSSIEVAAVSPTNPDLFFVRVRDPKATEAGTDYWRTADGGQTFTKVLSIGDTSDVFVIRTNGDIFVGARLTDAYRSTDGGVTFTVVPGNVHAYCATEAPDGWLWVCLERASPDSPSVAKTQDLTTWTPVYLFRDPIKPVACAPGTVQYDKCQLQQWCGIKVQFGIAENTISCSSPADDTVAPDAPFVQVPPKDGCCSTTPRSPSGLATLCGLALGTVLLARTGRRRRRRRAAR